ncbi:ATP-binding protein [Streptomyces sp. BG9H]|uniref:ATP-binding protein n=1 Tax=Streptomyces anatolicus TaxID=2675858 RepID=A0ABS6YLZ7_9ACTN|nr:ATP-binding protein [Streptomyces anatolicus]
MPTQAQPATTAREFTQRLSATPRGARLARRLARFHMDGWGIAYDSELSDTAEAIVAELAANAATHGRVPGRDFELRLTLRVDTLRTDTLRIEVSDTRAERMPPRTPEPPEADGESGRGLVIVAALAAEWGVVERQVGKTVWAELRWDHGAAVAVSEQQDEGVDEEERGDQQGEAEDEGEGALRPSLRRIVGGPRLRHAAVRGRTLARRHAPAGLRT